MTTYTKTSIIALVAIAGTIAASVAYAQNTTTMPVLYNQNNSPVNTGASYLTAGNYYLGAGPSSGGHLIEYYGNGTFYDATIQMYGGSISDPNGTAGAPLGYVMELSAGFNMAVMPTLFNSNNTAVNTGTGFLAAGYYNLGGHQVYYYGNGTFYDPSTQTYGGSISNPKGTAGTSLGYSA
jgi:hypothetical protein